MAKSRPKALYWRPREPGTPCAEKILAQVSQNNSLTADGAYYIAQILSDKGEKEQAQRLLEQLMTNDPIFANRAAAEELQAELKAEAEASAK